MGCKVVYGLLDDKLSFSFGKEALACFHSSITDSDARFGVIDMFFSCFNKNRLLLAPCFVVQTCVVTYLQTSRCLTKCARAVRLLRVGTISDGLDFQKEQDW